MNGRAPVSELVLILAVFVACSPEGSRSSNAAKGPIGGTIVISTAADPDVLLPPLTLSVQGKVIVDQIFDNLADIGPALNTVGDAGFTPRLSDHWTWAPDSMSIAFHINPRARWHDGAPVSAEDVRYTFGLVKDTALASPLAGNLDNIDSVSVVDSLTARVWFHQRTPDGFFKAASPVAILPSHLLKTTSPAALRESAFARSPVGSGRFRFASWERGARVVLQADSANYRGRPNADRVIWLVSADYPAAAVRFLGGGADFLDVVKPELVPQVKAKGADVVVSAGSLDYGYVAFNLRNTTNSAPHPILGDRETRRALVMAVDRAALVRSIFDSLGMVAHGPATRIMATSDTTIGLAYDPAQASRTLDSLGWKRGADGIRTRGGKPLAFSLMVPSSSSIRMKFAVLLQEQWRKAGANVRIEPLEANAFGARIDSRKFESLLNAWHIDPTPSSVREEWASSEIRRGGYNATSYSSPSFDAVIDTAVREMNPAQSAALYRRAYRTLTDDAPAMWLYEVRNARGVSRRIHAVGLRPDAWWANIADWSVNTPR
ncbi:MAG: peptide/nickel transport system substrate-binding protein [Gemmatimonadaceae bacterium]|jgi:peptide/nickel transport system substrate-binding protein|nr:peptide/nickel transport system substrate-binding protein [Gemmatimonadaceae bacterium]